MLSRWEGLWVMLLMFLEASLYKWKGVWGADLNLSHLKKGSYSQNLDSLRLCFICSTLNLIFSLRLYIFENAGLLGMHILGSTFPPNSIQKLRSSFFDSLLPLSFYYRHWEQVRWYLQDCPVISLGRSLNSWTILPASHSTPGDSVGKLSATE